MLAPELRQTVRAFAQSPELSRTMTSMFGAAQEQACAILEHARRPVRLVADQDRKLHASLPINARPQAAPPRYCPADLHGHKKTIVWHRRFARSLRQIGRVRQYQLHMRKTMAATILSSGGHRPPHQARSSRPCLTRSGQPRCWGNWRRHLPVFSGKPDMPLALYGAGNLGRLACDFLTAVGHGFHMSSTAMPSCSRKSRAGPASAWCILTTSGGPNGPRLAVSLVTSPYVPLERSLFALGFEDIVPFYDLAESFRDRHPLSNGWFAAPLMVSTRGKPPRF